MSYKKRFEKLADDIVYWWLDTEDSGRKTALWMAGYLVRRHDLIEGDKGSNRFARMREELEVDKTNDN